MEQFRNKVLFIENEEMLQQVQSILNVDINSFVENNEEKEYNYLGYLDSTKPALCTKYILLTKKQITLKEFKKLLKQQNGKN